MNKSFLVFLLLFQHLVSFGAEITCSDGACSFDSGLDIRNDSEDLGASKFDIYNLNENISVTAPSGSAPRSAIFELKPLGESVGNLSINLSSERKLTSGGSVVVFAPSIENLDISSNGRNGDPTDNISKICAQKINAGDFGIQTRSKFLLSRLDNPLLPSDRCVAGDLTSIQNNEFSCSSGFSEQATPNLTATRWTPKRTCEAQSDRKMCVQRKMKVSCTWNAEKIVSSANSCDNDIPSGNSLMHYKPPGPGHLGKQWTCDPTLASSTATGWKINFDPFIVTETWVQSRRLSGASDEDICDELTGRYTTYFTNNFPDITNSVIYYGYQTNSGFNARGTSFIQRLYWFGKNSKSAIGNPLPHETFTSNLRMLSGLFRACYSGGSHSDLHTYQAMTAGCAGRGYVSGVYQGWTGYAKFGGKGHTFRYPSGVNCWPDVSNNRMLCDYPLIGEAFSTVHEFKLEFYGPHGRRLDMIWMKGIGRY